RDIGIGVKGVAGINKVTVCVCFVRTIFDVVLFGIETGFLKGFYGVLDRPGPALIVNGVELLRLGFQILVDVEIRVGRSALGQRVLVVVLLHGKTDLLDGRYKGFFRIGVTVGVSFSGFSQLCQFRLDIIRLIKKQCHNAPLPNKNAAVQV
ncbi:MAG: hypothetical protein K5657_10300, partial [Desulfovibrio sp.]|nr:hypothetical protein [Desulfovibrio sp.]